MKSHREGIIQGGKYRSPSNLPCRPSVSPQTFNSWNFIPHTMLLSVIFKPSFSLLLISFTVFKSPAHSAGFSFCNFTSFLAISKIVTSTTTTLLDIATCCFAEHSTTACSSHTKCLHCNRNHQIGKNQCTEYTEPNQCTEYRYEQEIISIQLSKDNFRQRKWKLPKPEFRQSRSSKTLPAPLINTTPAHQLNSVNSAKSQAHSALLPSASETTIRSSKLIWYQA